jgi:hypothetical protein
MGSDEETCSRNLNNSLHQSKVLTLFISSQENFTFLRALVKHTSTFEEPMRKWAMQEIKEVIKQELADDKFDQAIDFQIARPFTLTSITMYLNFWYNIERYRSRHLFLRLWNRWNQHFRNIRRLSEPLTSQED